MNVTNVYTKKQYICKKCNSEIFYGKVTDESGRIITKDGKVPNGKFGMESNVLSGAVNANDKTKFHECYLQKLEEQYREATSQPQQERPIINNMPDVSKDMYRAKDIESFLAEWNDIYMRSQPLISKVCGPEATATSKHIATCGLIHDYFQNKTATN